MMRCDEQPYTKIHKIIALAALIITLSIIIDIVCNFGLNLSLQSVGCTLDLGCVLGCFLNFKKPKKNYGIMERN
jgi:hypothetical protein